MLVGNAAQTLHPIAGQGFNLGLRDVMSLAETLTQAENGAEDVGDYAVLARYQQRRESDRDTTIGVTNNLVYLFANHWAPLVVGRNAGLIDGIIPPCARCAGGADPGLGCALNITCRPN